MNHLKNCGQAKKKKKKKVNELKEEKQIKTYKICLKQKMLFIQEQIALTFCTSGLMPTNFFFLVNRCVIN